MYFYLVMSILYYSTGNRLKKKISPVNKFTLVAYNRPKNLWDLVSPFKLTETLEERWRLT
jgi:hypothetical protein